MQYRWEPAKDSGFKGHIMVEVPSYNEQVKLLIDLNTEMSPDGKIEPSNPVEDLKKVEKQNDLIKSHIKSVDIVHSKSKKKFGSFDELTFYREGKLFLNDIVGIILNGPSLGND